mmetsp:Transcript_83926/g.153195  ORF Transcript_83926/g.153195 Transcript_83926/m.153195 type:complete len:487 (-) Transcript_83926:108-1568(-)
MRRVSARSSNLKEELPRTSGCFSYCVSPGQLLDILRRNSERFRREGFQAFWNDGNQGGNLTHDYDSVFDIGAVLITRQCDSMVQTISMPRAMTSRVLEKAMAEGGNMTRWEPRRWKLTKTLAKAAAGIGRVDLMTSQDHSGHLTAVKRLPLRLLTTSPKAFRRLYPHATEHPWTDIGMLKHLNGIGFPYVCDLLGVFVGIEQAYIMTSFANAGDLFAWCQDDKSQAGLEREEAMRPLVVQIFNAVRWLHNLSIAHRDLSLENVLLTGSDDSDLQVKVIDFGMATLSRTAREEVRGKPSYQAPEMHGSGEYDTFLADNFAVGVIVYCMAVHNYPWEHTTPGMDVRFEFARRSGLEAFWEQDMVQCVKKPVAEVFSKPLLEILCGLLAINPALRYSLGEVSFASNKMIKTVASESTLSESMLSEASTTDSLSNFPVHGPSEETTCSEGEQSGTHWNAADLKAQGPSLRVSVWHSQWPFPQEPAQLEGA